MNGWLLTLAMLAAAPAAHEGVISGKVTHDKTGAPVSDALVILQCACLRGTRETQTNADGFYAFRGLPAGVYTVQVLAGFADVSKVVELPATEPKQAP